MTDAQLVEEIHTLLNTFPYNKWEPKNWVIDHDTYNVLRTIGYGNGMVDWDKDMRPLLMGYPVKLIHAPFPDRIPDITEVTDIHASDFFVLTLEGKGNKTGRTYYHDSEKCHDIIVAERNNTLLVKLSKD